MKSNAEHQMLERLFAGAKPRQEDPPAAMPLGFASRVVQQAFARRDPALTDYFPMVRIALGVALLVLCVSILINMPLLKQATAGITEFAIQHHLTSQVLSIR